MPMDLEDQVEKFSRAIAALMSEQLESGQDLTLEIDGLRQRLDELSHTGKTSVHTERSPSPQVAVSDREAVVESRSVPVESAKRGIHANEDLPTPLLRAYLSYLLRLTQDMPLVSFDCTGGNGDGHSDLELAALYTTLFSDRADTTREREPYDEVRSSHLRRQIQPRRLSVLAVLNDESHLVLLGEAGSGKTTFINYVALCLAGERLGHPVANLTALASLPEGCDEDRQHYPKVNGHMVQPWDHGPLLPVRVVLRDFAARGLPKSTEYVTSDCLWRFITAELPETLQDFLEPLRNRLLNRGGLLLLDGLDEVPEPERRRQQIKDAIEGFAAAFPKVRIVVTSRIYAYQERDWRLDGFSGATIAPFGATQIRSFVRKWYAHMSRDLGITSDDARGRAISLETAIMHSPRLLDLARRPLLLTLIAGLHTWRGGALPEKREELYANAVELLLDRWERRKIVLGSNGQPILIPPCLSEWLHADRESMRLMLNKLAFEAHRDQRDLVNTADIAQDKLAGELMKLNLNPDVRLWRLIEYLRDRAGLLLARGIGIFTFPHRTLQEYLAACHLTDDEFPDKLAWLLRTGPNRWREVVLLAGAKAARGTTFAAWALAEELCHRNCPDIAEVRRHKQARDRRELEEDCLAAFIAAQVLMETGSLATVAERDRSKVELIRQWLTLIVTLGILPPTDRVQAGRALSEIGDPRNFVELIAIPSGPFHMGDSNLKSVSFVPNAPEHPVTLREYRIAKYPITVGQWREFAEATDYSSHPDTLKGPENYPVVYVSWHDAQACCRWLTETWRRIGKIEQHEVVRLPTEAEWEKAARGDDRRLWPWGNEFDAGKANTNEAGIGSASSVGCFPDGASPYGCLDMAGNVWEWTQSSPQQYPYAAEDGREDVGGNIQRAVRGGGWLDYRWFAHCSARSSDFDDTLYDRLGFRVVVSSYRYS